MMISLLGTSRDLDVLNESGLRSVNLIMKESPTGMFQGVCVGLTVPLLVQRQIGIIHSLYLLSLKALRHVYIPSCIFCPDSYTFSTM